MSGIITLGGEGVYVFLFMYVIFYRKTVFRQKLLFSGNLQIYLKPKKPAQKGTKLIIITWRGDEDVGWETELVFLKAIESKILYCKNIFFLAWTERR